MDALRIAEKSREVIRTYRDWQKAMKMIRETQKDPPADRNLNDLFGSLAVDSQTKQADFYAAIRELDKEFPEAK